MLVLCGDPQRLDTLGCMSKGESRMESGRIPSKSIVLNKPAFFGLRGIKHYGRTRLKTPQKSDCEGGSSAYRETTGRTIEQDVEELLQKRPSKTGNMSCNVEGERRRPAYMPPVEAQDVSRSDDSHIKGLEGVQVSWGGALSSTGKGGPQGTRVFSILKRTAGEKGLEKKT